MRVDEEHEDSTGIIEKEVMNIMQTIIEFLR
jgi:hypothetical protein